jgi:hypothetical protein
MTQYTSLAKLGLKAMSRRHLLAALAMAGAAFVVRKGVVMAGIENVRIRFIAGFAGRSSGPLPQAGSCKVRSSIFLSRRRRTGIWHTVTLGFRRMGHGSFMLLPPLNRESMCSLFPAQLCRIKSQVGAVSQSGALTARRFCSPIEEESGQCGWRDPVRRCVSERQNCCSPLPRPWVLLDLCIKNAI